jgi:hypothetical protein
MFKIKLKALKAFRSVTDHKTVHAIGDVLETQDVQRVNNLVSRGLAAVVSIEADKEANADQGAGNGGDSDTKGANPDKVAFRGVEYDPQELKAAMVAAEIPVAPNAGAKGIANRLTQLTEDQENALAEKLTKTE